MKKEQSKNLIIILICAAVIALFFVGNYFQLTAFGTYTASGTETGYGYGQTLKLDALATLKALPGANVDPLKKAITDIQNSLNSAYWINPTHVICKSSPGGDTLVFAPEKDAVSQLMRITPTDKLGRYSTVRAVILDIVSADRILANTLYSEAQAANPACTPLCGTSGYSSCIAPCDKLKIANAELNTGDKKAAEGKYNEAVDHYKKSWSQSEKVAPICKA